MAGIIAIDAEPVHLAPERALFRADDGAVILGLAGLHAGIAADADRLVDDHAPGAVGVFPFRVERSFGRRRVAALDDFGVVCIFCERCPPDGLPPLHAVMVLEGDDLALAAEFPELHPLPCPKLVGGLERIRIAPALEFSLSRAAPAKPERDRDHAFRVAGLHPGRDA